MEERRKMVVCKESGADDSVSCEQKRRATPPSEDEEKLLDSLANLFTNYFNPVFPVAPSHVAPAPGGAKALDALLRGICEPGDGVLVPGPCWRMSLCSSSWGESPVTE